MSEQEPNQFNFWWTTSKSGGTIFGWFLAITGVIVFFIGWGDEGLRLDYFNSDDTGFLVESLVKILLFYVAIDVVAWYFIVNIGRFAYYGINRTETVQTILETRREKAELESLRRRKELKELRKELGEEPASKGTEPLIEAANEPRGGEVSPMSETAFFLFILACLVPFIVVMLLVISVFKE